MSSEVHQQRSQLINDYKTQVRGAEKELKKKKIPQKQREQLEEMLEKLHKQHDIDLSTFDEAHGIETKKKHVNVVEEEEAETKQVIEGARSSKVKSWGGLSKKELEEACSTRGLSKKGTKEELISRLTIWSVGHADGAADTTPTEIQYETFNPVNVTISGPGKKDEFREKRKRLWKKREAGPLREGPREDDDDSGDSEHGAQPEGSEAAESESDESADSRVNKETLQKQRKREEVVRTILVKILDKYKEGVHIDEIENKLKEFKVANFTPQLLGYGTNAAWISAQPRDLLSFNIRTGIIKGRGYTDDSDDEE